MCFDRTPGLSVPAVLPMIRPDGNPRTRNLPPRQGAACDPRPPRYPNRSSITLHAARTTLPPPRLPTSLRRTAGLSLDDSQACPRLTARLTVSPPFVRVS